MAENIEENFKMRQCNYIFIICFLFGMSIAAGTTCKTFPPGFKIGAATSAYQIEGAVNEGGRGESMWDRFVHRNPSPIKDGSTADIAADSYHRFKEDVQLIKDIGFDHYRFSISWVRIQPRGEMDDINQEGIDYYNNLINELIANDIEPLVTMYHWDLPQTLQDLGGWSNPVIADYFEDYAYILFSKFGDRVKRWITINEPSIIVLGYNSDMLAPGLSINGSGKYLAAHNLIRAHARAYRLYESMFKQKQKGEIGIAIVGPYFFPLDETKENQIAAERALQFDVGWFAHPIFSKDGDYPKKMRDVIDKKSAEENRRRSRLPTFTPKEIEEIKGSADFFCLNHYTSHLASTSTSEKPSFYNRDMMVHLEPHPSWNASFTSPFNYIVPTGLRGILKWIKDNYNNPPVLITENGFSDLGEIDDHERINFFNSYLSEMLKANYTDNCNVIGYTAWSLMDNFEWSQGYSVKYGIIFVDYSGPEPKRVPKKSSDFFKQLNKYRQLDC